MKVIATLAASLATASAFAPASKVSVFVFVSVNVYYLMERMRHIGG